MKKVIMIGVLVFIAILVAFGRLGGCDVCGDYTNPVTGDPLEIKKGGTFYSEEMGIGTTGDWKREGNRITLTLPIGLGVRGDIKDGAIVFSELGEVYIKSGGKPPRYEWVVGRYIKEDSPDEYIELRKDGKYYQKEKSFVGRDLGTSGEWKLKGHTVELYLGLGASGSVPTNPLSMKGVIVEDKIYFSGGFSPKIWVKAK